MIRNHRSVWPPMVRTILVGLIGLAALAVADTAHADFADCAAVGYAEALDARMAGIALPCDEAVRFTIETPGGTREVRIVYGTDDLSPGLLDFVANIRRGVEQSARTLMAIGEGAPADITVWASHLTRPVDSAGSTDAQTTRIGSECAIAAYPGGDIAYIIAHEFFHCVQYGTVGSKTGLVSSTWWVEGTAEWFASATFPGGRASDGDVSGFDSVSDSTALTAMGQEAVVFFFWLDQNFGASMAMALMAAMPNGGGQSAQQDALAAFLSTDDFQRFAQDYMDRRISQPGGRAIPSRPFPGDIYPWTDSREHTLQADRFVLARYQLEFACGPWTIERRDERGTWKVSLDEEPWIPLADNINVSGPDPDTYRVAGFGTEANGFNVLLDATRDPCAMCSDPIRADDPAACLIGAWTLDSGGYGAMIEERLRDSGLYESIDYPDLASVLIFGRDGSYTSPATPEDYTVTTRTEGGDIFEGIGTLGLEMSGQWSVDGDLLKQCEARSFAQIDLTIIDPDGDLSRLVDSGGPEGAPPLLRSRRFICTDTHLTLIEEVPFMTDVVWEYSRSE